MQSGMEAEVNWSASSNVQTYADVVFIPKRNSDKPVMIIELKWSKSADGAILQIKKNHYDQVFEKYGSNILLVGINYDSTTKKHKCVIEKF